ncbi:MAG: hypothetical protein ACHQ4F_02475 [Candidatus Dormibacteria bacterium]
MGIASAIQEGSLAHACARTLVQERHERARRLQDFEDVLESVEAQNLQAEGVVPEGVRARIADLARTLTVPAPAAVWTARSGARLHDALMTWQGALLDELCPHRVSYVDRFD